MSGRVAECTNYRCFHSHLGNGEASDYAVRLVSVDGNQALKPQAPPCSAIDSSRLSTDQHP